MRRLLCLLAVALLAAAPSYCRQLKYDTPSTRCVDDFNAMLQDGACNQGTFSPAQCCAALAEVGDKCLDAIVAAMEQQPEKWSEIAAVTKSLRSECGSSHSTGPGPSDGCVHDFNALVQSGVCGKDSSLSECCAALSEVGSSCLAAVEAAMEEEPEKYADTLSAIKSLRSQCGTSHSSGSGSTTQEECVNGLMEAFDKGGACTSQYATDCCDAMETLGTDCLNWFLEEAAQADKQVHDALYSLLQACGWTSSGSSTRAATEVTTQAMTALQAVGAAKLGAVPQAGPRALIDPSWVVEAPAATAQRTAFSAAMLVKSL
jgi:hypothetical protein